MSAAIAYYILIHTTRNEIFFGLTTNDLIADNMTLLDAQMVVRYSGTHGGVLGLCVKGPNKECRISPPATELYVRDVKWACPVVSAEAIAAFKAQPWNR